MSLPRVLARRYAGSLFTLASETGCVDIVGEILSVYSRFLDESDDFRYFVSSPLFVPKHHLEVLDVMMNQMDLNDDCPSRLVGNFLRVVASSSRLSILSTMIEAFHELASFMRGEIFAKVVSAHALDACQKKELKSTLDEAFRKDVNLQVDINPIILSGLIVRIGSHQIDASLCTKLSSLKHALKEVVL